MNLSKLDKENINVYLYGWKGLARYFGVSTRTLQRWDQSLKIPWEKSGKRKKDPVRIHIWVADEYYKISKT